MENLNIETQHNILPATKDEIAQMKKVPGSKDYYMKDGQLYFDSDAVCCSDLETLCEALMKIRCTKKQTIVTANTPTYLKYLNQFKDIGLYTIEGGFVFTYFGYELTFLNPQK